MAHLKTQETRRQPQQRLAWKLSIVKRLYQTGYNREEIRALFGLIDWMMALPKNLARGFLVEIDRFQEENKMPYVTSIERLAYEKRSHDYILSVLEVRFETVPDEIGEMLRQVSKDETLKMLLRNAVTIVSLEAFRQLIEQLLPEEEEEIEDVG